MFGYIESIICSVKNQVLFFSAIFILFFFVNPRAFPHQLTMKQMDSDHIRIYIREIEKDIFYQLEEMK